MLLLASAMLALSAPEASAAPVADEQVIVVKGRRNEKQQVRNFVRSLTLAEPYLPLTRFNKDVCPAAVGLGEPLDAAIAARMRAVAKAAAIPTGAADCRPNTLVIVADDKREMLAALRKAHPAWFRDGAERPIVIPEEEGPAIAWQVGGMVDRSGRGVPYNATASDDMPKGYQVTSYLPPSRISMSMRPVAVGAMVIIERRAIEGLTATQVGDYAAMRAFSSVRPDEARKSGAPTILTILDAGMDEEVPITMSAWDLGYLKGLYASNAYRPGIRQRTEVAAAISKEIEARKPEE